MQYPSRKLKTLFLDQQTQITNTLTLIRIEFRYIRIEIVNNKNRKRRQDLSHKSPTSIEGYSNDDAKHDGCVKIY